MHIEPIIRNIILQDSLLNSICNAIAHAGGTPYAVGGLVRDIVMHHIYNTPLAIADIDIEVHGLSAQALETVLCAFGPVSYVGKSFGVLKVHGSNIDFALPRTDSSGRKPEVTIDPFMGITNALRRRDVTVNALALNLITYELVDPFGGYSDIEKKILRSPDIAFFAEDPLRFYRVMQFIARFEMYPDEELQGLCRTMDISRISIERIELEFEKVLLKSKRPSLAFRWLQDVERLSELLPELYATIATEQEFTWHPEGSVFEHSMQALDAAARMDYGAQDKRLIGLYAALCHDLGKVETTVFLKGRLRSPGHDIAGVPLAKKLLQRITRRNDILHAVPLLVAKHMQPYSFVKTKAGAGAYKRLAIYLGEKVTIEQLILLGIADKQGRNGCGHIPLTHIEPEIEIFERKARELGVLTGPEKPIVLGKDLMGYVQPGPEMGELVKQAYEIQINENILDKTELIKRVIHQKKSS